MFHWVSEIKKFNDWLKQEPKKFHSFFLNCYPIIPFEHPKNEQRREILQRWSRKSDGILIMTYDLFRNLSDREEFSEYLCERPNIVCFSCKICFFFSFSFSSICFPTKF